MNKKQKKIIADIKDMVEMMYMLLELERVNPGKNIARKNLAAWINTEFSASVSQLIREEDEN